MYVPRYDANGMQWKMRLLLPHSGGQMLEYSPGTSPPGTLVPDAHVSARATSWAMYAHSLSLLGIT